MSSIQFSITSIDEAVDEIKTYILDYYKKEDIDLDIEKELYKVFDKLDESLWVGIEYPYVDKVYRDSFYSYFASKHNTYYRDCIRISFFANEIKNEDFRSNTGEIYLKENFRGFLVVRPTFPNIIGRSLIDKRAFIEDDFIICNHSGSVSINGVKLKINGFPHCSQDTESISCAETTIWSVMEYFGNRYPDYKPTYPSHIIEVLNKFSKQRLLPTNGLTVDQISFALKQFGFGTSIYSRNNAYDKEIENIIAYYIESGIPVIAAIENDIVSHVIVIIGHQIDSEPDFTSVNKRNLDFIGEKIEYIDYTDLPKKYIVSDDNLPPYCSVELSNPAELYGADSEFAGCNIEAVIVPLYNKIYLEVQKAKNLALAILSDRTFGFKFNSGFIFRFYLTSSRSFKEHIANLESLDIKQKDYIILSRMPKFIWCAEIFEQADFQSSRSAGLLILDATEANKIWIDSLIFAGYPDRLIIKADDEFVTLPESFNLYQRFKNNLG
jgi:hypothetical protein